MAPISIPDPSLVVLIGAAGSGKSTFAERHFDRSEILSSDAFRALISGDAADQTVTRAAFGRLHRGLAARLARGQLTVVDATNVDRAARRALLRHAAAAGLPAVAIVLDLPPEIVLARNAARRGRTVDDRVVVRHLKRLRRSIGDPATTLKGDGFDRVVHLRTPAEIDDASIVRVAG